MAKRNFKSGFTLIEILVVITIMAVLSAIIYASFNSAKAGSRDQKRVSDLSSIQLALEHYFNTFGTYPTSSAALVPTYINELPTDPSTNAQYAYVPLTRAASGASAAYCTAYQLWTTLETNSSYLAAKANFDSADASTMNGYGFYLCGNVPAASEVNPQSNAYVYDVFQQ